MKVKDLIKELLEEDMESEIFISADNRTNATEVDGLLPDYDRDRHPCVTARSVILLTVEDVYLMED